MSDNIKGVFRNKTNNDTDEPSDVLMTIISLFMLGFICVLISLWYVSLRGAWDDYQRRQIRVNVPAEEDEGNPIEVEK